MNAPKRFPYLVRIGARANPRMEYGVMAESSFDAHQIGVKDAEPGERVEVIPIGEKESFGVKVEKLAMQIVQMREAIACC